jgi:two-component system, NarL family, nitrate/nitrite response regulator NarL
MGAMSLEAFDKLSLREQKVLMRLMRGATARQICDQDYVSLATVRSQIHAIISKLGVNSQLGAVVLAYQSGWRPTTDGWREQEARRF